MAELSPLPWHGASRTAIAGLRSRGVHAILLHGPAGTGKFDLALARARDELCERSLGRAPACGTCDSCRLFAAGNHPDLRVVVPDALAWRRPGAGSADEEAPGAEEEAAPATGGSSKSRPSREIRIEQVRELASFASLSTHRGGARVVVLGPAETLNAAAANALLKGLEEPAPASLYLLVTDRIDRCLPTIVSRCSGVRVPVPPREMALNWLRAQAIPDAEERLTDAGGAPLAVVRQESRDLEPADRDVLLALLRLGPRLSAGEIASRVPREIPIGGAVALFQRWGWDYLAYRLAGRIRYHPRDTAHFEALSAAGWPVAAASRWLDRLRDLRAVSTHPLNARSAVEGALLDFLESLKGGGLA